MTSDNNVERPRGFPVHKGLRIVGLVLLGVIGAALFALAFGWFVQLLWNWLMPAIFGLGAITYWQAFGIVILAKLIFGALGGRAHNGGWPRWARRKHGDSEWGPDWGLDRWRHWRDFWHEEGRDAFKRFVERRTGERPAQPGE